MSEIDDTPAGTPIFDTWGQAVADVLNDQQKLLALMTAGDLSTNSSSPSDITGLSFPVVSGRVYVIRLQLLYQCAQTNQGPGIGFQHPGGNATGVFRVFGASSAAVEAIERIQETVAATDELTTAASVNSAGASYHLEATIRYNCTADGTFLMRRARNGTSGSTGLTILAGASALVHQSAIS